MFRKAAGVIGFPPGVDVDIAFRFQTPQRYGLLRRQRMTGGEHHHQMIPPQGKPLMGTVPAADDAQIRPVLPQRPGQRGAGALNGLKDDAGMLIPEPGHQMGRLAGIEPVIGAHGNAALLQSPQGRRRLAAALRLIDHLPHGGQQRLALPGGRHTAAAAAQQGKTDVLLQCSDHAADAGDGIAHGFRR